jgi:hypothetical protein
MYFMVSLSCHHFLFVFVFALSPPYVSHLRSLEVLFIESSTLIYVSFLSKTSSIVVNNMYTKSGSSELFKGHYTSIFKEARAAERDVDEIWGSCIVPQMV